MARRVAAREQGGEARARPGGVGVGLLEAHGVLGELIEIGSLACSVAVARHVIGAQRVHHDEEHVALAGSGAALADEPLPRGLAVPCASQKTAVSAIAAPVSPREPAGRKSARNGPFSVSTRSVKNRSA